jgi:hypothetical protein
VTPKRVKALVVINKKWFEANGMSDIVKIKSLHDVPDALITVVPASEYNLNDGWFLEMEFYPGDSQRTLDKVVCA